MKFQKVKKQIIEMEERLRSNGGFVYLFIEATELTLIKIFLNWGDSKRRGFKQNFELDNLLIRMPRLHAVKQIDHVWLLVLIFRDQIFLYNA